MGFVNRKIPELVFKEIGVLLFIFSTSSLLVHDSLKSTMIAIGLIIFFIAHNRYKERTKETTKNDHEYEVSKIPFNKNNGEDYLQQQEVILQKVINSLVEAIVVVDDEGKIIHYNTKAADLLSIPSFLLQKRDIRIIYKYIQPLLIESHTLNKKIKEAYLYNKDITEEIILKDGRCLKLYITSFEVYHVKGWILSLEDITIDKRQRISIEETQKNYEKLLNSIPYAMIVRKNDICVYANETAATFFGYNHREDLIGVNLKGILPEDFLKCLDVCHKDKCMKNFPEFQVVDKSGSTHWAKMVSCSDYQEDSAKLMTFQDITIEKSTKEMEKRMEENEFKIDFYTSFSHELKTPINIISAVGHMLKNELKEEPSKALEYINTLNVNCNRLIRNINNSIDINKLDTGFYSLNKQYYNIVPLIEEVVQSAIPYMEKKDIQCIFDTYEEEIITRIDINAMERVVLNLLSNAIKFTPPKGKIIVQISKTGKDLNIMVEDTGIGIKKEYFEKIFKRYDQENQSLEHNPRGSGLGLYLTKNLIEMHGGRIMVDSVEGKGSTFKIVLPIEEMKANDHLLDSAILASNRLDPGEIVNIEMSEVFF